MRIGVDFDNTIVCCDPLFYLAARKKNLIPADMSAKKSDVRDYLRKIGKESDWTELQGVVYGQLLQEAKPFPGVLDFFSYAINKDVPIFVVSHKTRVPFLGEPFDLHKAAIDWLIKNKFVSDTYLSLESVYFELTKEEKLNRIDKLQCTHFIDDLPEFLSDPRFPKNTQRILFNSNEKHETVNGIQTISTWSEMKKELWKK